MSVIFKRNLICDFVPPETAGLECFEAALNNYHASPPACDSREKRLVGQNEKDIFVADQKPCGQKCLSGLPAVAGGSQAAADTRPRPQEAVLT
jgi:hypothetical protein